MTGEQKQTILQMRRQGMSYGQISDSLDISKNTIKSFCRRNHLQEWPAAVKEVQIKTEYNDICQQCGKQLKQEQNYKPKRFCSDKCRFAWWGANRDKVNRKAFYHLLCICCGRAFESYGNKNRKYCGHACYIKDRFDKGDSS